MDKQYEIIKFKNDLVEVDVKVSPLEETVWLNQEQMALLFNVNISAINKHIKHIILENELEEYSTISKMEIVQNEGNRQVKRTINFYTAQAPVWLLIFNTSTLRLRHEKRRTNKR